MSLRVQSLSKSFGDHRAVDDISFHAPENSFCVVVGASGCGKSTLLRLIAGLETPDEGEIALGGATVFSGGVNIPPEERRVGVVFQSYALWPHMTVAKNVAFPYEARGLSPAEAKTRAEAHLEMVSLSNLKDRKPEALSGGQRQRVALARCLAGDAQTILMDEPLANLDPHLRSAMEEELRAFHDRSGVTTLYITHDQREAMALADVMAVMDQGRFLQIGPPQEIYERPATEHVARFIGRGAVIDAPVRTGLAQICGQDVAIDGEDGARVFLRPKDITVGETGSPARIASVLYRGGLWEATADMAGLSAPVILDLTQSVRPGEIVHLTFTGGWALPF